MSAEAEVRNVIARIDAAWKRKAFIGLSACFHEEAVIVGPGGQEYARGREKCAESYREFATNTAVLAYEESGHRLQVWETVAVYAYAWEMTWQREQSQSRERGTDQIVFQHGRAGWELVWRCMTFAPAAP